MKFPRTKSQWWAKHNGACLGGRHRLGKLSLAAYWVHCHDKRLHDLCWFVRRFTVPFVVNELPGEREKRQFAYASAVDVAYIRTNRGRWKGQHVRYALEQVMREYNVHFPMWLF